MKRTHNPIAWMVCYAIAVLLICWIWKDDGARNQEYFYKELTKRDIRVSLLQEQIIGFLQHYREYSLYFPQIDIGD